MREQARREEMVELEQQEAAVEEEPAARGRFTDKGQVPAVNGEFGEQSGASELVFAQDRNEEELKAKVGRLVERRFGGDFKKAFTEYDADGNGAVARTELMRLLADAGVGNAFTRAIWANRIIERLDTDGDMAIAWSEFETAFAAAQA